MTDTRLTQSRKLLEGGGTTAAAAPLLDDNLSKEEVSQRITDSEGERATGHLHRKDLKALKDLKNHTNSGQIHRYY